MRYSTISLTLCALLLQGCVIDFDADLTMGQKEVALHDAAQSAVVIALTRVYENDITETLEQAEHIKGLVDSDVLGLGENPTAAADTVMQLLSSMPPEYAVHMKTAMRMLSMYVETPGVSEVVDENNYRLVVAFLRGISDGCQLLIESGPDN